MKIKKNGKVFKLTENDLTKILKRVISEQEQPEEKEKTGKKQAYVKHYEEGRNKKQLAFILPGYEYKGKKFVDSPYILIGNPGKLQRIRREIFCISYKSKCEEN